MEKIAAVAAKLRLIAVVLLLLVLLLILIPAPTYTLWKVEIAATERGHFAALIALGLLLPGWRRSRISAISFVLALVAVAIALLPLVQSFRIGSTLSRRFDASFATPPGVAVQEITAERSPVSFHRLVQSEERTGTARQTLTFATRMSGPLQLDLYRNAAFRGQIPLVVVVHGGSWQAGSRTDLAELNYHLARQGYAIAAVSYRFAPRHPHPAATEDVNAAIDFLKLNATALSIDPSRIVLLGRSAGGHLALLSAYTKRDPAIRGVIGFYPPTDQSFGYENPSRIIPSRTILEKFLSGSPTTNREAYRASSPVSFVDSQTVPTLLIHGTRDELVSVKQSRRLAARLAAAGGPHLLLELPWATHGCDFGFTGPCGQLSTYAVERFLNAVTR